MDSPNPYAVEFRRARERAGLSLADAAERMGVSPGSVRDIEDYDGELLIYSPERIRRFCQVLGISPAGLLGVESRATALTAVELVSLIREHCHPRGISVEQFEDASGWNVAHNLDAPENFLRDYDMEAIHDICGALGVDWHRFILSL